MKYISFYFIKCVFYVFCSFFLSMPAKDTLAQQNDNATKKQVVSVEANSQVSVEEDSKETYGELWSGKLYTSTYRAGVCTSKEGKMRGVLLLKLSNGQVDVYHFYGSKDGQNIMYLYHNYGHRFVGHYVNDREVAGEITLKNGFSVKLTGQRTQNVLLTERCGPLAE